MQPPPFPAQIEDYGIMAYDEQKAQRCRMTQVKCGTGAGSRT